MGGADSDDEMGMGVDGEYGLGWNDEVAPSRRKTDRERRQVGRGLEWESRRWPRLDALSATQRASPAARESCRTQVRA